MQRDPHGRGEKVNLEDRGVHCVSGKLVGHS